MRNIIKEVFNSKKDLVLTNTNQIRTRRILLREYRERFKNPDWSEEREALFQLEKLYEEESRKLEY